MQHRYNYFVLLASLCVVMAGGAECRTLSEPGEFDLIVEHGKVIDGTGNPWIGEDIGITGGTITALGDLSGRKAKRRLDATGLIVSPGFIDMMGQDTLAYVTDRATAESRLRQGITTHVSGEGWSHAPQNGFTQPSPISIGGKAYRWTRFSEYFSILEKNRVPVNIAVNVGATQVRQIVLGNAARAPTTIELAEMKALVAQAMQDGAGGLSSALIYPPATNANTDELVELAKVAGRYGGFYSTHMRNESAHLLEAVDEAITIGQRAGLPVHIYHLKAAGQDNWPLIAQAITKIDGARARGVDVTADIYPYIRNGIDLRSFINPGHYKDADFIHGLRDPEVRKRLRMEIEEGSSGWENWYQHVGANWAKVLITAPGSFTRFPVAGLSLADAATKAGVDPWELFFDLIEANGVEVAPESMNEAQKILALKAPWVMFDTDTNPTDPAVTSTEHPRAFGTFPRILAKYVRDEGVITLEDAIRRMTSLPAQRLGLKDRGILALGMAADIVVFDQDKIADLATFEHPTRYSVGVQNLLVNGQFVIDQTKLTGRLPGKILRHNADR